MLIEEIALGIDFSSQIMSRVLVAIFWLILKFIRGKRR